MDTRLPKDLVLCLDGTGNEFGDSNSNVVKLYATLAQQDRQVCYYHPGMGTRGDPNALTKVAKLWTNTLGLAFGYSMSRDLADAYSFVMAEYEPGDRLFVFGFSRGAYTARALCGMLHLFGLLRTHEEVLIQYMIRMMGKASDREMFRIAEQFRDTFSRKCPTYFLGVWDTVSSVGWIYSPIVISLTQNNPDIQIARHVISLDERRASYRQNLLGDGLPRARTSSRHGSPGCIRMWGAVTWRARAGYGRSPCNGCWMRRAPPGCHSTRPRCGTLWERPARPMPVRTRRQCCTPR